MKKKSKKRLKKIYSLESEPTYSIAKGDRCVCCGRPVPLDSPPFLAVAHTRKFPVCSKQCLAETESYVYQDKRYKVHFYIMLFLCAALILIGSLNNESPIFIYPAISVAGLDLILFPYPITSFETFFSCSICRLKLICRILGVLLLLLGILFLIVS